MQVVKAMEVAQLANEGAFIGGTAAVTFAIVLVVSFISCPNLLILYPHMTVFDEEF